MRTYAEVRQFCVKKLARILYDCLACSQPDRAMLDWLTAERCVDTNKHIVYAICSCFEAATDVINGQVQDFEMFDRLCGRAVWDGLYRPMRKTMGWPHPDYSYIRFH